jgi:hypothetical protein
MMDQMVAWLRTGWMTRALSGVLVLGIGTVFTLSALLEPSPAGHGTHLQLGLGTCTFLAYTGVPCPMCGATTSFTLMAHLRVFDALINQPFATGLFLLAAFVFAVSLSEIVDPRGRWGKLLHWLEPRETRLALLFLGAMGASWVYKMFLMLG